MNDNVINKSGRSIITVPYVVPQKHKYVELPDQETIQKRENLELQQNDLFAVTQSDKPEIKSNEAQGDTMQLKINWQQYMVQFEQMRNDLAERQKAIVELYASMLNTHQKMTAIGQKVMLPPSEDLTIMNVAKLSPDQLLQLCAVQKFDVKRSNDGPALLKSPFSIDINKLYGLPSKIIATCEQTIFKRKEIIDWFVALKSEENGISKQTLERKMNEFNSENEMLRCSLEQAKGDFLKELNEIVDFMRKTVNEAVALQIRTEEQMCELSELNSQNSDLRKQIHNTENLRPHKGRVEDLEKDLKEERTKNKQLRDRLSRADGQIKIGVERASQLEAALEQARSQTWSLERTTQQLNDQNQKLQADFDKELCKLTESIRENTTHLEEIADARGKLQTEKEDLEKRIEELSNYYNESLQSVKHDMNSNVAKLIETEKKYEQIVQEKENLETKYKSTCAQLLEYDLRNRDIEQELQRKQELLDKAINCEKELENVKCNLDITTCDLEEYKGRLVRQSETIKLLEHDLEESINLISKLKANINNKEEYITDLEKKQSLLEEQLQESDLKMNSYEQQLGSLKSHIAQLQKDFGEFENLNELHDMVNQQRAKLLEATKQNGELAQALQKKDSELEQQLENQAEQEQILEQKVRERDAVIKMLSEKEEEQTNIIKLLRNNLEMRTQADADLSQQITDKNAEIKSLVANVKARKQQISQLEKIILTLEEETRKSSLQRRKDQDKITLLEKRIQEFEDFKHIEAPANNLDSIIKILEDELDTGFDPKVSEGSHEYLDPKQKYTRDRRRELQHLECLKGNNQTIYPSAEHETIPTKIVMGNFVKKTYISNTDDQYNNESLDRKKAITNMDTQKWLSAPQPGVNTYAVPPPVKDNTYAFRAPLVVGANHKDNPFIVRNLPFFNANQFRDERQCKMFKLAGHRL
ncbi:uncharacterized protein LOC142974127 [Anticarsia gemmatalis]|uniref:uncharacterized protein LOC142974127 n=1 Tax=Anticarsia gemmatalis TaxID=129554 RepID=UPI003F773645